jgi:hypothetical protein
MENQTTATPETQAPVAQPNFPTYYRLGGLCLRRETDTTTTEVRVPDPGKALPLSHQNSTYPSKARLDEMVASMQQVDGEIFEDYLGTFFQSAAKNRDSFNAYRQRKFEAQQRQRAADHATFNAASR